MDITINKNKEILGFDNKTTLKKPVKGEDGEMTMEPVTVGEILIEALMSPKTIDDDATATEKIQRANMAGRIYENEEKVHFDKVEVKLLKEVVNKANKNPIVVKRIYEILEPEPKKEGGKK